jgi:hypothetical protein
MAKRHSLYRSHDELRSELLSQIVEDLPNVQSFEPRSKSAFFFKSLLSRRPELSRRLGLDARCDLNRV